MNTRSLIGSSSEDVYLSLCIIEIIIYYQRNNVILSINGTTEQISFFCGGFSGVWNSTRSVRTSCPSDPRERERETGLNDDPPQREREDFRRAANISTWPGVGFAITPLISTLHKGISRLLRQYVREINNSRHTER